MSDAFGLGDAVQYGLITAAFMFAARLLYQFYNSPEPDSYNYTPWNSELPEDDTVVVDCTHPTLPTLSHHRGHNNPPGIRGSDTSTGLVLNALSQWNRDVVVVMHKRYVTTNHFDIDSFLSVWCYINRKEALEHDGVLRHMARIGDFREAFLSPDLITAHGAEDHITFIREAYTALKLCCWINTIEKRLFSAPYEGKDCEAKMLWFLPRFGKVLDDPESAWSDWQQEYTRVVSGFDLMAGADCMVETPPGLGLAVLSAPEPLHYYSLFSHSIGYDVVLMMYDDNRYEVECKYTQFVNILSRPTWPRLDLGPLAAVLNKFEAKFGSTASGRGSSTPNDTYGTDDTSDGGARRDVAGGRSASRGGAITPTTGGLRWVADSFTDTGPLLRLEKPGHRLTKAQRYGQPYDRPIYSSSVPPRKMQAIVQSYLGFGLQGLKPEDGGWNWQDLQDINQQIHWQDWASCISEQLHKGELDQVAATQAAGARRRSLASGVKVNSSSSSSPNKRGGRRMLSPAAAIAGSGLNGDAGPSFPHSASSPVHLQSAGVALPHGGEPPVMSHPSVVAQPDALAALAASLPALHKGNPWLLIYSTSRDGISLATMMRKAEKVAPSLLLIRDDKGAVFGAYVTEAWQYKPRFYGTGETYVFQLEPRRLTWSWVNDPLVSNNFFQFVSPEGLGIGGAGHWAVSVDEELLRGSSGPCDTFASPCLASREEFEIIAVELWHVH